MDIFQNGGSQGFLPSQNQIENKLVSDHRIETAAELFERIQRLPLIGKLD